MKTLTASDLDMLRYVAGFLQVLVSLLETSLPDAFKLNALMFWADKYKVYLDTQQLTPEPALYVNPSAFEVIGMADRLKAYCDLVYKALDNRLVLERFTVMDHIQYKSGLLLASLEHVTDLMKNEGAEWEPLAE